jgi:hypothetical protein
VVRDTAAEPASPAAGGSVQATISVLELIIYTVVLVAVLGGGWYLWQLYRMRRPHQGPDEPAS